MTGRDRALDAVRRIRAVRDDLAAAQLAARRQARAEGISYREIAAAVGISVGKAHRLLST
jgi:DNA-directed RNA polymerase specialized sigma24 family protein